MGLRRKKGRHNMTHKIRRISTMRSLLWLTACVGPLTQWGEEISLAPEKARVRAPGPSDAPPPCIEPQYLDSGRGKSSSRTPVGPS